MVQNVAQREAQLKGEHSDRTYYDYVVFSHVDIFYPTAIRAFCFFPNYAASSAELE